MKLQPRPATHDWQVADARMAEHGVDLPDPFTAVRYASEVLGDFYQVEDAYGLCDTPCHGYDPNRLVGWRIGGSGWPTYEGTMIVGALLTGRVRTVDRVHAKKSIA